MNDAEFGKVRFAVVRGSTYTVWIYGINNGNLPSYADMIHSSNETETNNDLPSYSDVTNTYTETSTSDDQTRIQYINHEDRETNRPKS